MTEARELSVTRFIAAPPEKVWHAMTERQEEWWCPRPWRAEFDLQDRRPGGLCNATFYGPDGEKESQNGIYLAWDVGRRFATTDAVTGDLEPAGPFMIGIWEIAREGDGTRYTATARLRTPSQPQPPIYPPRRRPGRSGWSASSNSISRSAHFAVGS